MEGVGGVGLVSCLGDTDGVKLEAEEGGLAQ